MKQLNNNTFGKNSWSCHWEKLCFLRNTLGKIPGVATTLISKLLLFLSRATKCKYIKQTSHHHWASKYHCPYQHHHQWQLQEFFSRCSLRSIIFLNGGSKNFSQMYCCLVVSLICLSFINYNLLYCSYKKNCYIIVLLITKLLIVF